MAVNEQIPYCVVESIWNKLNSPVFHESGLIKGVECELQRIKERIGYLKEPLLQMALRREQEPGVQLWTKRLKNVLLPADDFFDEVATEYLRLKRDGGAGKIACEIKRIDNEVNDALEQLDLLNMDVDMDMDMDMDMTRLNLSQGPESARHIDSDLIGREDEKMKLVRLLTQPPQGNEINVSWIGIVGVGGIGKTAVAQMVYFHEDVKASFEKRMWVHASGYFNVRAVVKKIIDQLLTSDKSDGPKPKDYLVHKLREILSDKKYLLVLDDICNEPEILIELKSILMCGARGSKIIVTTRSAVVDKVMKDSFSLHLKSFSEVDSWSLLKKLVFRNDDQNHIMELEPVGKEIAMKCRGSPLAIKTVADKLSGTYKECEWIKVLESDFWKLDGIMSALKLTYLRLSPRLRQCFAYLLVYPKDWEIEKKELVQLWMAQGYLESVYDQRQMEDEGDQRQMEDEGNEFVETLRKESFFQDAKIDEYGNLVSFKLDGLIHDLALVVAGNDYYYLNCERKVNTPMHVCFTVESNTIDLLGSLDASRLRTFFLQRADNREFAQITGELYVILRFKCLRILNLSHSSLKKLPDFIGKLKHLRYVDLSWCVKLASLPKSIGNLVNLQTLKLTGCETLEFSTEVVTKLINLRHLEIHRCKAFEDMMPAGLGKLSSLQSLSSFHVVAADDQKKKAGKLNELQNLNKLSGNLEISRLDQVRDVRLESQDVNLKDKKLLVSLDLDWGNQEKTGDSLQLLENLCPHECLKRLNVRWYPGDTFSNWLSSIQHLSYIYLFGFHNCKSLPPLEHLPCLKSLEICSMKALEYICSDAVSLPSPAAFFQSLERLQLSGCEKLQGWKKLQNPEWMEDAPLPLFCRLSQLIINKCPKLIRFPAFPNVKELQLQSCNSMVMPLRATLDIATSSTPLSMLKSLKIGGKLLDTGDLPSHWKGNLTSLEYLEIGDVEILEYWFEESFPSLREIVIYDCDSQALPDKMCDLLSLEHIKILGCHKLASLPDRMSYLINLKTLEIWDCPLLVERCQRETGADWPKISKIQSRILKKNERR